MLGLSLGCFPEVALAQNVVLTNNLTGSIDVHDPCAIVKENGTYYSWGTRGVSLKSEDRVNWTRGAGNPAPRQSWWEQHGGEQWAPAVHFINGYYYYYYSVSAWFNYNSAIGVTRSPTLDSDSPDYEWTDQGRVIDSTGAQDGGPRRVNVIDPNVIQDEDGKYYLIYGSFEGGVRMSEIDSLTGLLKNDPPHPTVITDHAGEGSSAIQVGDYYYYAISDGTCCDGMNSTYHINYGRATEITGPYLTKNGQSMVDSKVELLLSGSNNSNASRGDVAVGVGGFFWDGRGEDDLDTLFMVYHAYAAPSGRAQMRIHPVYLDDSDWLTMDKNEGSIITRSTKMTSVQPRPENSHYRKPRLITRVTGMEKEVPKGTLYGIRGQKIAGETNNLQGIFIVKPVSQ